MLQAWISSPRGSLYFAAPATAYNLETLRSHVRALRDEEAARTCLALNLGGTEDRALLARVSALVAALTLEGIHVRFSATVAAPEAQSAPVRARRRRAGTDAALLNSRAHG
ncbi:MAG: hypothetical protein HY271_01230 [Deltaproteobacteria bacterium]|nr:hypothetical protein [Deltaproteobacteria bacterium]